ncbi:MAG: DUF4058 family protein [Scytonema sp. PMC 1069.18]|nr:DUF4058 family protein [Scytonema sp. PMC 1069.18]MEC4881382.1 DUF4058 family protein [Scytonema sp. PMC 1070.18]
MPSPFPGMNPYLENPALWSGIHHRLITAIANDLAPKIRPNYIAAIEERVYEMSGEASLLVGVPDVSIQSSKKPSPTLPSSVTSTAPTLAQPIEVTLPLLEALTESYLEIRSVKTGEVITVIEVLSPKNKQSIVGRLQYETKRQKIFRSNTHLVEIDLLRQGKSMPILEKEINSDYQILVSRSNIRPKAELYQFNLQDKIPQFLLPLRLDDTEPVVDLQKLLHEIYDQGGYDLRLDYSRSPVPNLSESDVAWTEELLKREGLR